MNSESGNIHGTLIIGVIGTDGILIAVDSRAEMVNEKKEPIAYIDSIPKLFLLNNFPVAIAGKSTIGNDFVHTIIDKFNNVESPDKDVQETFIDFKNELMKLPEFNQMVIGAGYYNNLPSTFAFDRNTQSANGNGFITNDCGVYKYLTKYSERTLPCNELKKVLEDAIYQYANDSKQEYFIGGPISIAKITDNNKVVWMQNDFRNRKVKNYTDFANKVESGEIKVTPVNGNSEEDIIKAMKQNPRYGH